jgi:hypothetical protein
MPRWRTPLVVKSLMLISSNSLLLQFLLNPINNLFTKTCNLATYYSKLTEAKLEEIDSIEALSAVVVTIIVLVVI